MDGAMMRFFLSLVAAALLLSTSGVAFAKEFRATEPTQLIELFTSEGCSSCPPADEWLHDLGKQPGLWTDFVPVAFHVDYWDYLGWKDIFSTPEFSERH